MMMEASVASKDMMLKMNDRFFRVVMVESPQVGCQLPMKTIADSVPITGMRLGGEISGVAPPYCGSRPMRHA
jgi:hypothetical protein